MIAAYLLLSSSSSGYHSISTYLSSVNIGTSAIGSMCVLSLRKSHHIHGTIPPSSLGTSSLPGVTHTQGPKSTPEQLRHRRSGRHADVMTPNALQPSCLCFCFSSDGPVFLPSWTLSDCRLPRTAINTRKLPYIHHASYTPKVVGYVARMTE